MWRSFQTVALQNERGVALLESQLYFEALTEFVEAYTNASCLRQQALSEAANPFDLLGSNDGDRPQRLFSLASQDMEEDEEVQTGSSATQSVDQHYIYPSGVTFWVDHDVQDASQSPICGYGFLNNITLLMATCLYNMSLCFHLRSRFVLGTVRQTCQRFAVDLYDRAIETVGDPLYAFETIAKGDANCLLVILLNNKAVICFELEDYTNCQIVRSLLVLCLNKLGCGDGGIISADKLPHQAFLETDDLTNMYRIAFLLEPPLIAGAA
ncbi:expressed unknown protein [Seminavis robusta]|uniref:Uncharacterized protein n=1 Tax=Seminavis robusta TaxID=568900 RepID=A0A9N8D937_9STRA|nr:expressed unknown protein [Seminavis robusta]|eukprot:Sro43_g026050.1 n/a (268) ;mRNA; f:40401-41204